MGNTDQIESKSRMPVNRRWRLAAVLLGLALISPAGGAAEVQQFKDGQGTLHITNPGEVKAGKAGAGAPAVRRTERPSPEASPETPKLPQAPEEAASEPVTALPHPKAVAPEPATSPPAEEEESQDSVSQSSTVEAKSPVGAKGEEPPAVETQPRTGRSLGRSGGGMRGRR